jgi:hypothetical protein
MWITVYNRIQQFFGVGDEDSCERSVLDETYPVLMLRGKILLPGLLSESGVMHGNQQQFIKRVKSNNKKTPPFSTAEEGGVFFFDHINSCNTIRYSRAKHRKEIVNNEFQFETLYELVFTIVDISPIVALYGPIKKAATAPASIETVKIYGETSRL